MPCPWTGPETPFQLAPDSSSAHPHGTYRPDFMALPALLSAVDAMGTHVDWPDVDVVANRGSLRRLADCMDDCPALDKEFRVDVQLVGEKTLSLHQWTSVGSMGYGFAFEAATTHRVTHASLLATSHHRVIQYVRKSPPYTCRPPFGIECCIPW